MKGLQGCGPSIAAVDRKCEPSLWVSQITVTSPDPPKGCPLFPWLPCRPSVSLQSAALSPLRHMQQPQCQLFGGEPAVNQPPAEGPHLPHPTRKCRQRALSWTDHRVAGWLSVCRPTVKRCMKCHTSRRTTRSSQPLNMAAALDKLKEEQQFLSTYRSVGAATQAALYLFTSPVITDPHVTWTQRWGPDCTHCPDWWPRLWCQWLLPPVFWPPVVGKQKIQ